jgi:hypothetical protein
MEAEGAHRLHWLPRIGFFTVDEENDGEHRRKMTLYQQTECTECLYRIEHLAAVDEAGKHSETL